MKKEELLAMNHEHLARLCMKQEFEVELLRKDYRCFLEHIDSLNRLADRSLQKYALIKGTKKEKLNEN